ncbi:FCD domain-containing protein [Aeoliella sp.]|uniref:FCD domain-containing protein n=1 Tax=Aeoliella sp. TaxID=2795800 RepID=UPI003CCBD169
MARLTYTPEAQAYYDAYKLMMQDPDRFSRTAEDKIRSLVFAITDSTCPLYCHIERGILPSVSDVAELFGDGASVIRDAIFRLSGTLGLLAASGSPIKLRPAIPKEEEFRSINDMRKRLEVEALIQVHCIADPRDKRRAVEILSHANLHIGSVLELTASYDEKEICERVAVDPVFGEWADDFWRYDRRFHLAAAAATDMKLHCDMLHILLERIRLSGSNRATIIRRIPSSFEQHRSIIEAVKAKESTSSAAKILEAVTEHFDSSNEDFGYEKRESKFA